MKYNVQACVVLVLCVVELTSGMCLGYGAYPYGFGFERPYYGLGKPGLGLSAPKGAGLCYKKSPQIRPLLKGRTVPFPNVLRVYKKSWKPTPQFSKYGYPSYTKGCLGGGYGRGLGLYC